MLGIYRHIEGIFVKPTSSEYSDGGPSMNALTTSKLNMEGFCSIFSYNSKLKAHIEQGVFPVVCAGPCQDIPWSIFAILELKVCSIFR